MIRYKIRWLIWSCLLLAASCRAPVDEADHSDAALTPTVEELAAKYFDADSAWYIDNVPFFECSDKQLEAVYYYRWKLFKAHLRNTGKDKFVVTEFINHVPWDREPWCTINAASMHHLYEGRWLKDDRYMDGYLNYLLSEGGNNRRYSESVADAAYARYLVNGDEGFLVQHLDSMKSIYDAWRDHWDPDRKLYYIAAMPDATEYDIASIDASGGTAGFDGGIAFRPTINSYMFGNAKAIARIAAMKGDSTGADDFEKRASDLRSQVQQYLWNPALRHFTDRYKEQNQFVKNWDFIRGRELAGMAPWYFNLPDNDGKYVDAWEHVVDTTHLLGKHGLRTNEPSYQYYFTQFVFFQGKRGSQWNGPSWPYQSSQTLTAMANLLNNYDQKRILASDHAKLLRLYARQHYLPDGTLNLVENYDPNLGGPIVYYYWSNHYNHSTFNNLIITGLCGIRPAEGDSLLVNPLVDDSIQYFRLQDVAYHGHRLTVVFDRDGTQYKVGKGLSVFVDGHKRRAQAAPRGSLFYVGRPAKITIKPDQENFALNIARQGYPRPSSSVKLTADTSLYQAIDGRIWYFPEITNCWTTAGSSERTDWLAVDFGKDRTISNVRLHFVTDNRKFAVPDSAAVEYSIDGEWTRARTGERGASLIGNTSNSISFDPIVARKVRVVLYHATKLVAVTELECY